MQKSLFFVKLSIFLLSISKVTNPKKIFRFRNSTFSKDATLQKLRKKIHLYQKKSAHPIEQTKKTGSHRRSRENRKNENTRNGTGKKNTHAYIR